MNIKSYYVSDWLLRDTQEYKIDVPVILKSDYDTKAEELQAALKENELLKRSEICGYCDFDNSLRKERDALSECLKRRDLEIKLLREQRNHWVNTYYDDLGLCLQEIYPILDTEIQEALIKKEGI